MKGHHEAQESGVVAEAWPSAGLRRWGRDEIVHERASLLAAQGGLLELEQVAQPTLARSSMALSSAGWKGALRRCPPR